MTNLHAPSDILKQALTRRLGRGLAIGLCVLLTVTVLTAVLGYALTRVFDNAQQWQEWRSNHYWSLFAWRLMLYATIVVAWLKLKARMPEATRRRDHRRLVKIEILFTLLILLAEFSKVLLQRGGTV